MGEERVSMSRPGCTLINWLGAAYLDEFVALIGSFAKIYINHIVNSVNWIRLVSPYATYIPLAPLQSLCAHEVTKSNGHHSDGLWFCCSRLHNSSDSPGRLYNFYALKGIYADYFFSLWLNQMAVANQSLAAAQSLQWKALIVSTFAELHHLLYGFPSWVHAYHITV